MPPHLLAWQSRHERRKKRIGSIMETPSGIILDRSPSLGVRVHDLQALKDDHPRDAMFNEFAAIRTIMYGDSGFQGVTEMGLPLEARFIERARRNHPFKRDQMKLNRLRCSLQAKIKCTISGRKK